MDNNLINFSNKNVAYTGSIVAVTAVFAYALVIMIYVVIRSSSAIYSILPNGERASILWENSFSVAYSVAIFSLLMALLSTMIGAVEAVILKKALLYFNPRFNSKKAILISCITAFIMLSIIYISFYSLLKERMTFSYWETFSFWFVFPAFIFFGVCIIGGSKLNTVLSLGFTESNNSLT